MNDLKERTKKFALDVLRHCEVYPNKPAFLVLTRQLMRAATSVGANYRAACRAKSKADFISKISTVEEEADESAFWLEMLGDLHGRSDAERTRLTDEAYQLVAIRVKSRKTARGDGT
jgi:four helix bundle protein